MRAATTGTALAGPGPGAYRTGTPSRHPRDDTDAFLLCATSQLRYPIRDGVPVMLIGEAVHLAPPEVEVLVARARQLGLVLSESA